MINFDDLSLEDKEQLLQQARLIIEKENLSKNAVSVYKTKRKDLIENNLSEIHKALHMKSAPDKGALRQRYIAITNFLFKISLNGKYNSKDHIISNAIEWDLFEKVNNIIKNAITECYNLRKEK